MFADGPFTISVVAVSIPTPEKHDSEQQRNWHARCSNHPGCLVCLPGNCALSPTSVFEAAIMSYLNIDDPIKPEEQDYEI